MEIAHGYSLKTPEIIIINYLYWCPSWTLPLLKLRNIITFSDSSSRPKAKTSQSYSFQDLSRMNVQRAPGQQIYYRPSQYENIPVIESCPDVKCHLTIALVLDSSGSVGYQNFLTELGFVKTLLEIVSTKI